MSEGRIGGRACDANRQYGGGTAASPGAADSVRGYAWDHVDPALPKFDKMPPTNAS